MVFFGDFPGLRESFTRLLKSLKGITVLFEGYGGRYERRGCIIFKVK